MKDILKRGSSILVLFIVLIAQSYAQRNVVSNSQTTNSLNGNPSISTALSEVEGIKGAGMMFTQNKGQLVDMDGNVRPDILYKGDGGGSDIYLRKTGVSYVLNNARSIATEINKNIEDLESSGVIEKQEKLKYKQKLMQKTIVKFHRIDVDFEGANPSAKINTSDRVEGYTNYYYAHCANGITNVNSFNEVTVKNIYNNIDVKYYGGKENGLKYDIVVNPGGNPNDIKLKYSGSDELTINHSAESGGELIIKNSIREIKEKLPKVYQNINGKIVDVKAEYKLNRRCEVLNRGEKKEGSKSHVYEVTFSFSTFNSLFPLVIDPWATYYGGSSGYEFSTDITTDNAGNVMITGIVGDKFFPVSTGAFQTLLGLGNVYVQDDAFVVKFNPVGDRLWATFYGGTKNDGGTAIDADNVGNIVITGNTMSPDFPVLDGYQMAYGGSSFSLGDAFVVEFDSAGVRQWATYYGGSSDDGGLGITTDNNNNVVISGFTQSVNFPFTVTAFQTSLVAGGFGDGFIVQFNVAGVRQWATFYGGSKADPATDIVSDNMGNIFVTGSTGSTDFPVLSGYQMVLGGATDAFLIKFNSTGVPQWATYYGGSGIERATSIALDNVGNIIIAGDTQNGGFPVLAAYQAVPGGSTDAFIVKFNAAGVCQWATYYGGINMEFYQSIVTDSYNNILLYMEAEDIATPTLVDACSYQPVFNGGSATGSSGGYAEDQLIIKFDPAGQKICATYMGGTAEDDLDKGGGITIFGNSIYITGETAGAYPVTPGVFQTIYAGYGDIFVASICANICEGKLLDLNFTSTTTSICANSPVKFTPSITNSCDTTGYKFHWVFAGGTPASSDSVNPTVSFSGAGTHDVKLVVTTICKKDSIAKPNYITVNNCGCTLSGQFTKGTASCSNCGCKEWLMINATGGTPPYTYQWSAFGGYDKRYKNKVCPGNYNIKVTDKNGCSVDINVTSP